jgi:hypothetical protein
MDPESSPLLARVQRRALRDGLTPTKNQIL